MSINVTPTIISSCTLSISASTILARLWQSIKTIWGDNSENSIVEYHIFTVVWMRVSHVDVVLASNYSLNWLKVVDNHFMSLSVLCRIKRASSRFPNSISFVQFQIWMSNVGDLDKLDSDNHKQYRLK
jgi:hypothetical protein